MATKFGITKSYPINAQRPIYRTFAQNFNFNLGRDLQKKKKKSHERSDYELVDEKSLSQARYVPKNYEKRIHANDIFKWEQAAGIYEADYSASNALESHKKVLTVKSLVHEIFSG